MPYLVLQSGNAKIGVMSATYLPIAQTCPEVCPLKNSGCYAQGGHVGIHVRRLEKAAVIEGIRAYDIVRREAREIIRAGPNAGGRPLRLHVSGDARTDATARLLGQAARSWDGPVYTYTHAWRTVRRKSWDKVSVLASCESIEQARHAQARGYAASIIIVSSHASPKAYMVGSTRVIPCPQQTRGVTCVQCGLCLRDSYLRESSSVIAFAAHGVQKKKVALKVLS